MWLSIHTHDSPDEASVAVSVCGSASEWIAHHCCAGRWQLRSTASGKVPMTRRLSCEGTRTTLPSLDTCAAGVVWRAIRRSGYFKGLTRQPRFGPGSPSTRKGAIFSSASLRTPISTQPMGSWSQGGFASGRKGGVKRPRRPGVVGDPAVEAWVLQPPGVVRWRNSGRWLRVRVSCATSSCSVSSRSSIWARRPGSPGLLCQPLPRSSAGSSSRRARHLPPVRSTRREQHRAAGDRRSGHSLGRESPTGVRPDLGLPCDARCGLISTRSSRTGSEPYASMRVVSAGIRRLPRAADNSGFTQYVREGLQTIWCQRARSTSRCTPIARVKYLSFMYQAGRAVRRRCRARGPAALLAAAQTLEDVAGDLVDRGFAAARESENPVDRRGGEDGAPAGLPFAYDHRRRLVVAGLGAVIHQG
jgi:hypothetical protein